MKITTKEPDSVINNFDMITRVTVYEGCMELHFKNSPSITLIKEDDSKEWGSTAGYGSAYGVLVSVEEFESIPDKLEEYEA